MIGEVQGTMDKVQFLEFAGYARRHWSGGGAGRFAGGGDDGCQFLRFCVEGFQTLFFDEAGFGEEFEPVEGFVRFFFADFHFGEEVWAGFGPAGGAVVGSDGGGAADELFGEYPADGGWGEVPGHGQDAQGEGFGAGFHFLVGHFINVAQEVRCVNPPFPGMARLICSIVPRTLSLVPCHD